jgi:hypothetical protein
VVCRSKDIINLANDVLEGRKRNMKFHDDKSELYPLKGFLKCPVHNTSLTAYACKSQNKELHHYYLCCKGRCKQRHCIKDGHESMDQPSPYKTYISKIVPMLENLTEFYREPDGKTKRKILGCIFSEKLVLEKGRVATTPFTVPIQVLFKITKVLQGSKNKKEVENNLLSTLAPQVRLELTTHGLTVRCSNQLSY